MRTSIPISKNPRATAFTRYVKALAMAQHDNSYLEAADIAAKRWPDSPEVAMVLRSIIEPGDRTTSGWASQLARTSVAQDFLELHRGQSIFGRLRDRMREFPFTTQVPRETTGGTGGSACVTEGGAIPVRSLSFTSNISLSPFKAASISVITSELLRHSAPSAEEAVRRILVASHSEFIDQQFLDPTAAAISGTSPGSVTSVGTSISSTGSTSAAITTDLISMTNGLGSWNDPFFAMKPKTATAIQARSGNFCSTQGGQLYILGIPAIVSNSCPSVVVLADANDICFADEGISDVSISTQGMLEMETAPTAGESSPPSTQSVLKSLYTNNLVATKVVRTISWGLGHSTSATFMSVGY